MGAMVHLYVYSLHVLHITTNNIVHGIRKQYSYVPTPLCSNAAKPFLYQPVNDTPLKKDAMQYHSLCRPYQG